MPKPVKKTAKKTMRPKRDVNQVAFDLVQQTAALSGENVTPDFSTQLSTYMATLGRKGGRSSGAKRMEMPAEQRREIAAKAARARWAKRSNQT